MIPGLAHRRRRSGAGSRSGTRRGPVGGKLFADDAPHRRPGRGAREPRHLRDASGGCHRALPVRVPPRLDQPGRRFVPLAAGVRAEPDRVRAHPPGLRGVGGRPAGSGEGLLSANARAPATGPDHRPGGRAPPRLPERATTRSTSSRSSCRDRPSPRRRGTSRARPTDPIDCAVAGTCRRCARCGGHSANVRTSIFLCENCGLEF